MTITRIGEIARIGAIGTITAIAFLLCRQSIATGQIVPDSTLPTNSTVTPNGNTLVIEGGTPIGGNLFHSFEEFSLPTGSEAYFKNSLTIDNILSRVTGGSISNIDGILRANGAANLFLLNPNGIVFGPNAALNIGGSFFASTADSLILSDGSDFSATNPDAPPLLTINVPLGLQLGASPGKIINQSRAIATNSNGNNGSNGNNIAGLAVQPGKTIGLVGGDISIEGGSLLAPVGQIELVSLSNGFWQLGQEQNSSLETGAIANSQFGNIELTGESDVSTSGAGGGSIDILAGKLSVRDGSQLTAITEGDQAGGGLRINTAESVEVIGGNNSAEGLMHSQISTETQGAGAGGDLTIETGRLLLAEGGFLSASTFGSGAGGNITISASESVELLGNGFEAFERYFISGFVSGEIRLTERTTGIFTGAEGTGDSGNIAIDTSSFSAKNGTLLFTPSFAEGTGGNITIRASEAVEVSGSIFGASNLEAGAAGNIEIDTSELILANGGLLGNSTLGSGSSGNILVRASEKVEIGSTPAGALVGTGIFADSFGGTGSGGKIEIQTRRLVVSDGAKVSANSGLNTGNHILQSGGAAASIEAIATEEVEISGRSPDGRFRSALSSSTFSSADAGEVRVNTGKLIIRDGAEISTSTFGDGAGGNIIIKATEAVNIRGNGFNELEDNIISNFVSGELTLSDRVTGIFAGTEGNGASGNISIETPELIVEEGSIIFTPAFGSGAGGQISINADRVEAIGSGVSASSSGVGSAGTIAIDAAELIVREGAILGTSTSNSGAGGNIIVRASESVELSSTPTNALIANGISATTIGTGAGGNIQIETNRLSVADGARVSTTTGLFTRDGIINVGGKGGTVEVRASESVELSGVSGNFRSQVTASTFGSFEAGEVKISTGSLTVRDGAEISVATLGSGQGGSLRIEASETVLVTGQSQDGRFSSGLFAASGDPSLETQPTGAAGNLRIIAGDLIVRDGARVAVNSLGTGDAGGLTAIAREIILDDRATMTASPNAAQGGNINLTALDLQLRRGSGIATDAGASDGGNITIETDNLAALENSDISANAQAGFGGRVSINAHGIFGTDFRERQTSKSDISATSQLGPQFSGVVEINTPEVDPGAGLVKLPETVVDITGLVARDPCHHKDKSEFIITGRGGLPPSPLDPLSNPVIAIEWANPENAASAGVASSSNTRASNARASNTRAIASDRSNSTVFSREEQFTEREYFAENRHPENRHSETRHIVEATGWRVDANGDIILTADSPNVAPYRPGLTAPSCGEGR